MRSSLGRTEKYEHPTKLGKNRIFIWEVIMETEELTRLVDEIYKVSDQFFRSDELIISSNEFN